MLIGRDNAKRILQDALADIKFYSTIWLILSLGFVACKHGVMKETTQQAESGRSTVVNSERRVYDRLLAELDSNEIYDDNILYVYWFKPHEACAMNIFFHKDNT